MPSLTPARPLVAVFAVAALANVGGTTIARAEQKETERVDRTIPFAPGGTLHLKNFSGEIRITGTDAREVVIAAVRRATRERLDAVKLDISTSGSEIAIDANKREGWWSSRNSVVETDFDIKVPADTRLDLSAFSSDVRIAGVTARQKVHTFSGTIAVRNAGGPIEAESFSGDIRLELTAAAGLPELEVKTFSGDITARMPAPSTGTVRFSSFSGALESDLPLTLERGNRRNLRARLNNAGGSELYFKTFSGDVRITRN